MTFGSSSEMEGSVADGGDVNFVADCATIATTLKC